MNKIIPHDCEKCKERTMWFNAYERNYTYFKGKYYHSDCFYNKEKKKEKKK